MTITSELLIARQRLRDIDVLDINNARNLARDVGNTLDDLIRRLDRIKYDIDTVGLNELTRKIEEIRSQLKKIKES